MKKLLLKLLLFLVLLFFTYIVFMLYIISGDTKEYKKQCSKYIPILEKIHKETGSYPKTLEIEQSKLNIPYSLEKCGYVVLKNGEFKFYFSEGISIGGYESKDNIWWED